MPRSTALMPTPWQCLHINFCSPEQNSRQLQQSTNYYNRVKRVNKLKIPCNRFIYNICLTTRKQLLYNYNIQLNTDFEILFKIPFWSKLINFKVSTKYNINLISFIFKQLIRNESNLHIKYNPIKFMIKVHLKYVIILINLIWNA